MCYTSRTKTEAKSDNYPELNPTNFKIKKNVCVCVCMCVCVCVCVCICVCVCVCCKGYWYCVTAVKNKEKIDNCYPKQVKDRIIKFIWTQLV